MIIKRDIEKTVLQLAKNYPVLTITGPRQSGKTTLAKKLFKDYSYFSLEDPDIRELAQTDPRSFLNKSKKGIILDEIQRVPELISYIQGIVDTTAKKGQFILTGSHQFDLFSSITQSLAGRTAIIKLLPFSFNELNKYNKNFDTDQYLLHGFYPGIHNNELNPTIAYKNYFETYIQRDLRQIVAIKELHLFQKFVRLCAGRIGQIFSASSLSNDVGVSVTTIKSWLSILEASFIVLLLESYYENMGKRLIKSPKLYFYDVGLATYLLGIESIEQLSRDPLRGNLFENMILMEMVKKRYNQCLDHNLYFLRDSNNNEVDVIFKKGSQLVPFEMKSAATFTKDFLKGLNFIKKFYKNRIIEGYIVYSGDIEQKIEENHLINFKNVSEKI